MFNRYKCVEREMHQNKKNSLGLSLIEASMVLALAAVVVAGVMYYYQSASDNSKQQAAVAELESGLSGMNALYGNVSAASFKEQKNLDDVIRRSGYIPSNYIKGKDMYNPWGGLYRVKAYTVADEAGFDINYNDIPKSACIALGVQNYGDQLAWIGVFDKGDTTDKVPAEKIYPKKDNPATVASKCASITDDTVSVQFAFTQQIKS